MRGYTLAQVKGFTEAAVKLQRRRLADLMFAVRASQADKSDYMRIEKKLSD